MIVSIYNVRFEKNIPTLVLATPISLPALICTPQCVLRAIELPTVFVMPTHKAPFSRAYSRAFNVSAVSPD
ncbi:hypothetical protein HanRHA438_Chr11g0514131 [Helianthus annuus]|nr:hypothetical protein HanHA300_Chr11g0411591 [Helianthus annuus]KAJ0518242.1 hypothetical protein HanHA89_Chr11g0435261 [Helianthus annuus]KAJ0871580.1 hypothetical protein HanRHA438_Chr11g0514131 [Helianthus annuus]